MCPTGDGVDAGFVVDVEEGPENLLDSRTIYGRDQFSLSSSDFNLMRKLGRGNHSTALANQDGPVDMILPTVAMESRNFYV